MHVCIITESYISDNAMAGNNIHSELAELAVKGIKISVITNGYITIIQEKDNVNIYRIKCGNSKLYYFFFISKSVYMGWKINKKCRIDIVHAQWAVVAGFVSVIISRLLNIRSIVTCRGFDVNYSKNHPEYGAYRGFLPKLFVRFTLKNIDNIICISKGLRDNIKRLWGISRKNIHVIYPSIANSFFGELTNKCSSNKIPVILTVGSLRKIKRVEDVIKALGILKDKGIKFEYWIAGPPLENFENLQYLCMKYNIKDNVKFLGYIGRDKLISIYDSTDIYVNTSVLEGFGRTYLEAMARGKPIILTSKSGCSEVIMHMKTGIIVPPNDPTSISRSIETLLNDNKLLNKIGRSGYNYIINNLTMEKQINKLINIYNAI